MKKVYTFWVDDWQHTPPKNGAERCVLKFTTETDVEGSKNIKAALRLLYPLPRYGIVIIESNCGKVITADTLPAGREFSKLGRTYVQDNQFFIVNKTNQPEFTDIRISLNRKAAFNLQMALGAYLASLSPEK